MSNGRVTRDMLTASYSRCHGEATPVSSGLNGGAGGGEGGHFKVSRSGFELE